MDILDLATTLRDANRSLRRLFSDYDERAEPCRQILRRLMDDIPTEKPLVALTAALQAVVDSNGGEYGDTHTIQVHSLWLTAAAYDLVCEEQPKTVADRVKDILEGRI